MMDMAIVEKLDQQVMVVEQEMSLPNPHTMARIVEAQTITA
jgi:hypothetical protein